MFWMGAIVGAGFGSIIICVIFSWCLVRMMKERSQTSDKLHEYWEISLERMAEYSENMASISSSIENLRKDK